MILNHDSNTESPKFGYQYCIDKFYSDIFGFLVSKIFLESHLGFGELQEKLKQDDVKLAICRTPVNHNNIEVLENHGYRFMGTDMEFVFSGNVKVCPQPAGFIVDESFSPNVISIDLVQSLSAVSHYSKNRQLPDGIADKFYMKWVYNTFNGYADKVIVLLKDDDLAGFISLKKSDGAFNIDLLVVLDKYRGLGLAKYLISLAIDFSKSLDLPLFVSTQAENIPACRAYQKMGFLTNSLELVYHKLI